jgi:protein-tyrosine-phosphatase
MNLKEISMSDAGAIAVVCRANKVRSRVSEALLIRDNPNLDVRSFGTSLEKNSNVDVSFVNLMNTWEISLKIHRPRSYFLELDFLKSADLVVAADADVFSEISKLNRNTVNLVDFAINNQHVPVDPLGMSKNSFLENVSKVIHCTQRLNRTFMATIPRLHEVIIIVPRTEDFLFLPESDCYVIDASFVKQNNKFNQLIGRCRFEEIGILDGSILKSVNSGTHFYEARFEFNRPEMILISPMWYEFVRKVSSMGTTYVITEPLSAGGSPLWKSYLATYFADQVRYL